MTISKASRQFESSEKKLINAIIAYSKLNINFGVQTKLSLKLLHCDNLIF